MIPTMIVFGLLLGRWWRFALISAAIVWPTLLLVDGVIELSRGSLRLLPGAALFGVANAGAGVAVHQALLFVFRRLRDHYTTRP